MACDVTFHSVPIEIHSFFQGYSLTIRQQPKSKQNIRISETFKLDYRWARKMNLRYILRLHENDSVNDSVNDLVNESVNELDQFPEPPPLLQIFLIYALAKAYASSLCYAHCEMNVGV